MMDPAGSNKPSKLVICTLNNLNDADQLTQIIRACARTFRSLWNVTNAETPLERPRFYFEEDLNHDDDCGSFCIRSIANGLINEALAVLLDYEIDKYIKDRDLWSNRIKHEDYGKVSLEWLNTYGRPIETSETE